MVEVAGKVAEKQEGEIGCGGGGMPRMHFISSSRTILFEVSLLPLVWWTLPGENPDSIGKKWCVFDVFCCCSSLSLKVWAKGSRKGVPHGLDLMCFRRDRELQTGIWEEWALGTKFTE